MPHHVQFVELHTPSSESADAAGVGDAFALIGKKSEAVPGAGRAGSIPICWAATEHRTLRVDRSAAAC